ncbi:hypothetical protein SAMN03080601_00612 [Alkalitalea saponilacus]|uniref:Uncharacterized protein n=1 Tax=Alkalitalea saponilacus TaxID=889453 RepID=A0A1T5BSN0_9BACT|nr:hypothetical protein SAMN03080601_00612 [Alkalitalea saponilacus]
MRHDNNEIGALLYTNSLMGHLFHVSKKQYLNLTNIKTKGKLNGLHFIIRMGSFILFK